MPTPSGLLKPGDRPRHRETGDVIVVVERLGNGKDYSIKAKREDGKTFDNGRDVRLFTEMHYWLTMARTFELLPELGQYTEAQIVSAVAAANPDIERKRLESIVRLVLTLTHV